MKGAGIYTEEFDVPTAPICATSETTLLCLQDGSSATATLAGTVSNSGVTATTDTPF